MGPTGGFLCFLKLIFGSAEGLGQAVHKIEAERHSLRRWLPPIPFRIPHTNLAVSELSEFTVADLDFLSGRLGNRRDSAQIGDILQSLQSIDYLRQELWLYHDSLFGWSPFPTVSVQVVLPYIHELHPLEISQVDPDFSRRVLFNLRDGGFHRRSLLA